MAFTPSYEFVEKNVSKGAMVAAIREQLPGMEIIACGDYLNDNEMLAEADIGVAAANAHPETQKVAKYVGCAVEENLLAWVVKEVL